MSCALSSARDQKVTFYHVGTLFSLEGILSARQAFVYKVIERIAHVLLKAAVMQGSVEVHWRVLKARWRKFIHFPSTETVSSTF